MSIKSCFDGHHDLMVVASYGNDYDGDRVVRWCQDCGSIVVDIESDGRLIANHVKMRAPLITRESLAIREIKRP
jgi:hypothetical protein